MSSVENFGRYRRALIAASPPTIPYLGLVLTDLTMTDDGNSSLYPGTKLYNVQKVGCSLTLHTHSLSLSLSTHTNSIGGWVILDAT
jgi:hypothetical protein